MNVATLLFTGPALPYHVVDYAIEWAKENEGSLNALFIVPGQLPEEGYPFPNDLDSAENITTAFEAEKGLKEIMEKEIMYLQKRANASHIPVRTEVLFSPSIEQVVHKINQTEIIFVDRKVEENPDQMEDLPFTLEDIRQHISPHFLSVGELDRYSDVFY